MGSQDILSTARKALAVNVDKSRYGSFAEIGAGQEVARYFFKAGLASQTIAKTMSAYDMTFSDEIYGREESGRYVVESRLHKMLKKEFNLLAERLDQERGEHSAFFAYANTVATSSKPNRSHGWMGIRFQDQPRQPANEIFIHVKMKDPQRLQQQEAIGVLGVNLVHAAFFHNKDYRVFVSHLMDNLNAQRIEIDMIHFDGPIFNHFENRLASLELVAQGFTPAVLFDPEGHITQLTENFFHKSVLIQRGTFRPFTKTNAEIIDAGLAQITSQSADGTSPQVLLELTMKDLNKRDETNTIDTKDFGDRLDTLKTLNHYVLVSRFSLFYQLKNYLRQSTDGKIYIVVGASLLEKIFDEQYYDDSLGGPLSAFGQLFDRNTQLLVFPYKTDKICMTAKSFFPPNTLTPIYQFLTSNEYIVDISGCDHVDTSLHSEDVRMLLSQNNQKWEELVPKKIAQLIKEKNLFGYKK
ncbi:MAG: hypothetical protein KDD50_07810 [Bdellovibrionales bacterium]|nr:hypothetical protein [Bdellovibrionales bacterium]